MTSERVPRRSVCLLVLGMHRSGTSAFTRVLNLLGASLGYDLMGATPSNPRGHWERLDVYDLHNEIMRDLGTTWDDITFIPEERLDASSRAAYWHRRIVEILRAEFHGTPLYAIKDPRICLLLPLWRRAFDELEIDARPIIMLRHPLEVVASLKKRGSAETDRSLSLWLRYTIEAERRTRDLPRAFVSFEELLQDWRKVVTAAAAQLGVHFPNQGSPTHERVIGLFLNADDRHHRHDRHEDPNADLAALAIELFGKLIAAKCDPNDLERLRMDVERRLGIAVG